jgi:hypothetical protein
LSPAINLLRVSTTPAITENPWQGLIAGVVDTGDKFIARVVDTGEKLIASVVDTGEKLIASVVDTGKNVHSRISPRIFEKIRNGPKEILMGRGTLIHEKNLKSKILCQTPFKKEKRAKKDTQSSWIEITPNTFLFGIIVCNNVL